MSKKKKDKQDQPPQQEAQAQEQPQAAEEQPLTPEQERDDLMARLQRLGADYQNYQKRVQKDITQAREYANEGLIKQLLDVIDDMERALDAARQNHGEDDPLFTGMQMVHNKLLDVLGKNGLTRIEAAGQPFDPDKHAALMQQPSADVPPMTVLQEMQAGYELKGRTLRPTAVIVSKEADEPQAEEE